MSSQARPISPGQHDLLSSQRNVASLNTYGDSRQRDQSLSSSSSQKDLAYSNFSKSSSFHITASNNNSNNNIDSKSWAHWKIESTGFRPIDYNPRGSFRSLKQTGKLVDNDGNVYPEYKGRERPQSSSSNDNKHYIPGYTGFVRGSQHISGRTFGETTKRALSNDFNTILLSSSLPSSPQCNRKIKQSNNDDTFINNLNQYGSKEYHIPGYTGHVPGVLHTYSKTYGNATNEEINHAYNNGLRQSRSLSSSSAAAAATTTTTTTTTTGFADTALPRHQITIDSAPLPGGKPNRTAPDMFIPSYLRHLKYMSA